MNKKIQVVRHEPERHAVTPDGERMEIQTPRGRIVIVEDGEESSILRISPSGEIESLWQEKPED